MCEMLIIVDCRTSLSMSNSKEIKWVALQPLTGGMYLGFENIIGCPAQCIVSYKGLNDYRPGKTGGRGHCGNEYNLMRYLYKKQRIVPRFEFQHGMFRLEDNVEIKPDAMTEEIFGNTVSIFGNTVLPDFSDIDIVCAVPVCAGLSALTTTDDTQKELKNCNMKFLAEFALKTIKPKAYIFENAPGFMSIKGDRLRKWFEQLAWETGYRIAYFKTDTRLHHNCQRRPRTFVIMLKEYGDTHHRCPDIDNIWEDKQMTLTDVLSSIPSDATYQDSLPAPLYENETYIAWGKEVIGKDWREWFQGDVMNKIIKAGLLDEFEKWCEHTDKVDSKFSMRMIKHINHIRECKAEGRGWWSASPRYYPVLAPAIQSRTVYAMIHPFKDSLCSERDALTLMGMPYDFEMQGAFMSDGSKIGQNVPVKTAEWIARIALQYIEKVDIGEDADDKHTSPRFYDNIKKKEVIY